ncbi:MAG: hypothetical protein Q7U47_03480 [Paludibacter sp.]|nr:hypothetical protein [Paludibacter sp.]
MTDTLVYLTEYEVKDLQIYNLLDKAINHEMNYFRRNSTYSIWIRKESRKIEFSIAFLNEDDAKYFETGYCGYFRYRENLFFIYLDIKNNINLNKFFRKRDSKTPFQFRYEPIFLYTRAEETGWLYFYKRGKFIYNHLFDIRIENGGENNFP